MKRLIIIVSVFVLIFVIGIAATTFNINKSFKSGIKTTESDFNYNFGSYNYNLNPKVFLQKRSNNV